MSQWLLSHYTATTPLPGYTPLSMLVRAKVKFLLMHILDGHVKPRICNDMLDFFLCDCLSLW